MALATEYIMPTNETISTGRVGRETGFISRSSFRSSEQPEPVASIRRERMIDTPGIISRGINVTNEDIVIQDNFAERGEIPSRVRWDSYLIYMYIIHGDIVFVKLILIGLIILIRRDPLFRAYVIHIMIRYILIILSCNIRKVLNCKFV